MPTTRKDSARPARPQATEAARTRREHDADTLVRIEAKLEAAQQDLASLRGNLGAGAGDLRKDVMKLVRDARRDVTKMSKVVRRDLERLRQDLSSTPAKPKRSRGAESGTARASARRRG